MKYQFFKIPVSSPQEAQQEVNIFCASHRVATVEKQFVADSDKSFWAFCVMYLDDNQKQSLAVAKNKIDYREVLNEKDFSIYVKLRTLRKTISEKEGVPAYALFTNEQLATMIQKRIQTAKEMGSITGIGKARMVCKN